MVSSKVLWSYDKEDTLAWIKVIGLSEATGYLSKLYQKYFALTDVEDNVIMVHSLNPKSLEFHYQLYAHLMRGKSDLSRIQREMIGVVTSATNHCHYWLVNHGAGLLRLTDDQLLVDTLKRDWRSADISLANQAMLEYSEKLTLRPWDMEERDVIKLRDVGFTDAAILDINQVTSYFAFVNRVADGLGVELESILTSD